MTFEPDHGAPLEAGFEALTSLLRLIADPKSYQRQLDALMAASTRAKEEVAGADRSKAALAHARAEHDAHCAERDAASEAKSAHAAGRIAAAEQKEGRLLKIASDIRQSKDTYKRLIMRLARIDVHWSERLQGMPDDEALIEAALDGAGDADDIDGHEHMGHDADEAAATALPSEPPEHVIAGTTLTKTGHRNGAGRRAQ